MDDAVSKGAILAAGGRPMHVPGAGAGAPATSIGLFYPPTILAGVTHEMRIANEEGACGLGSGRCARCSSGSPPTPPPPPHPHPTVFGPIMSIFRVAGDSDDAAVSMANSTVYGLGATVLCGSPSRAKALAARLRCGMVGVNAYGLNYLVQDLPFGGRGDSGFGRFSGPEGLRECTSLKSVVSDLSSWASIPTPIPAPLQYPLAPAAPAFTRGLIGMQFEGSAWRRAGALGELLMALMAPTPKRA